MGWAQPPTLRSRILLTEQYQTMLTNIEYHPYELWVLTEALRLGLEHPEFYTIQAGYDHPNVRDLAKQLWADCRDRLADLDPQLANDLIQPS